VYPPTGDAVAFIRGALHADDLLWITDLDGRERALTPSGGYLMNVVWSPNGQRLAFTDTARSLFVVGRDGTGLRRVGAIREGSLLGWERAGILEQNRFRIRALDPANGRLQPLRNPCGDSNPTFSTDRRFVVCHGRSATVVRIRGRNGKLVRTVRVGAPETSTHGSAGTPSAREAGPSSTTPCSTSATLTCGCTANALSG
jgi:Tol biopolymer transport system component